MEDTWKACQTEWKWGLEEREHRVVEDTWKACQTEWKWGVGGEGTQSG